MAAQDQGISVTPAFFGRSKVAAPHAMSAEQFLGHMDRKKVGQQNQTDEVFIAQVSNYLWDEARDWYEKILPMRRVQYRTIVTDWAEFKKAFRKEYFEITSTRDTQLNWIQIRQSQGEVLPNFLNRLASAITESTQLYIDEVMVGAGTDRPDVRDQGTQVPLRQFVAQDNVHAVAFRDYLVQEYAPWLLNRICDNLSKGNFTQVAATGAQGQVAQDHSQGIVPRFCRHH